MLTGTSCGSSGGAAAGRAIARAAATVALAAVAEAGTRRRQRRRGRRNQDDTDDYPSEPPSVELSEPFEVFEYDTIVTEERRPLPLDLSLSVIEIDPEAITCEVDSECAVLVASCCTCAHGGEALAVRSDVVEELRAEVVDACDAGCATTRPEHITCTSEPACIHGLCRLIDDRDIGLPRVPEPPR